MKQKNKKVDFFIMLLGTLVASLLGNILAGKEVIGAGEKNNQLGLVRLLHPFSNFEIQKHC